MHTTKSEEEVVVEVPRFVGIYFSHPLIWEKLISSKMEKLFVDKSQLGRMSLITLK